jgi:hypothetical protein
MVIEDSIEHHRHTVRGALHLLTHLGYGGDVFGNTSFKALTEGM